MGAITLSAIITGGLFALRMAWKLRRAFKAIQRGGEILREGPHEWVERAIGDASPDRLAAFEEGKREFEAAGFRHVGDIDDALMRRAFPKASTALRVFLSADSTTIGLLHVTKFGERILDLESVLDDGRFLCACSAEPQAGAPSPEEVEVEFAPDAPLGRLLELHAEVLARRLNGAAVVAIQSLEEAIAAQNRISEARRRFNMNAEAERKRSGEAADPT